jgi:hypothetical protein
MDSYETGGFGMPDENQKGSGQSHRSAKQVPHASSSGEGTRRKSKGKRAKTNKKRYPMGKFLRRFLDTKEWKESLKTKESRRFGVVLVSIMIIIDLLIIGMIVPWLVEYIDSLEGVLEPFVLSVALTLGLLFIILYTNFLVRGLMQAYNEAGDEVYDKADTKLIEEEKNISKIIGSRDDGLLAIIRYSRVQLQPYYVMGRMQTTRSFLYGVVAMSMGLIIILVGIGGSFGLIEMIFPGTEPVDIDTVVIASGILVEMISALFLWLYSRTLNQVEFFFNRQIQSHSVLLAYMMAKKMDTTTTKDETIQIIVKGLLDTLKGKEIQVDLPTSEGLGKWRKG